MDSKLLHDSQFQSYLTDYADRIRCSLGSGTARNDTWIIPTGVRIHCRGFTETCGLFENWFKDVVNEASERCRRNLCYSTTDDPSTLLQYEPTIILCVCHSRLLSDIHAAVDGVQEHIRKSKSAVCIVVLHDILNRHEDLVESKHLLNIQSEEHTLADLKVQDLLYSSEEKKILRCDVNKATKEEILIFITKCIKLTRTSF